MPTAHECTQMAAECVAWAKNTSDPARRSAFMLAAQKWQERAEEPRSRPFRPWEPWEPHYHEIQMEIGRKLQAQLDLPKDMPHQILALLVQLTNDDEDA
jgi:hypothetical protein